MIRIIALGKIKEKFYQEAINEYLKRLQKYNKIEIIELKDENRLTDEENINFEGKSILAKISDKDYVIALDLKGDELTSEGLASKVAKLELESKKITIIIGGSCGLSNDVILRADEVISFSKLTFPHQLFRVIVLEQIYRAYKINNNETYHK